MIKWGAVGVGALVAFKTVLGAPYLADITLAAHGAGVLVQGDIEQTPYP